MLPTSQLSHCDCCSLPLTPQAGEDCPRCHYPIAAEKEEKFLIASLRDLQRVAHHGGANLTVGNLIQRYRTRLNLLRQLKQVAAFAKTAMPAEATTIANIAMPDVVSPRPTHQQRASVPPPFQPPSPLQGQSTAKPANAMTPLSMQPLQQVPITQGAPMAFSPPVAAQPGIEQQTTPRRSFSFSWKSFMVDQAITIIGLLGAFLILMGALSAIVTTSNRLTSFLIVFGVHAFFGLAGVIAYRFANFRLISRIYIGIYTLLVPLVGFTGYSLIQGNYIQLTLPILIAIAAGYATIVYCLLAVYQRFPVFGYLGGMALIVADLAIAQNLNLGYWWWPSMLMLLALPAIASVIYSTPGRSQFFKGNLAILRPAVRTYMYLIVGLCVGSMILAAMLSLGILDSGRLASGSLGGLTPRELRFAILNTTALLLLWTSLFFWLTKRTRGLLVLAFELLACVLASCYAFNVAPDGYVLGLTGTALLYHGLNRFSARLLSPFGTLGLRLDQFALVLVSIVPFVGALIVPFQLWAMTLPTFAVIPLPLLAQANMNVPTELIAIALGCIMTVSIALYRTTLSGHATSNVQTVSWPWLLLLSGFLLTYEYAIIVWALHVPPVWCFLGLTLALAGLAVLVRRQFGTNWSDPLEAVAVGEALLTLVFSLGLGSVERSTILLFVAAFAYGIVWLQRRQNALFVPLLFALAALPDLLHLPLIETLLIGVTLPLVAMLIHRLTPLIQRSEPLLATTTSDPAIGTAMWEWPLLCFGLLCGAVVSAHDAFLFTSAVNGTFHFTFPAALEMATLALVWYAASALARVRWWLLMAIGFTVGAVLLPSNPFWVLVAVTSATAFLAVLLSRRTDRMWASPLYIVALLAAIMTGITAYQGHLSAASWILPGFGLLAYVIGIVEDIELCWWLLPLFVTWSVFDAAMVGDHHRPPIVALAFVAMGVAISCLKHFPWPQLKLTEERHNSFLGYALPFYATALVSAILVGVFGTLHGANVPFYGAIPGALLLYALVAFAVLLYERQPTWLWLVAGFAVWGTLLAQQTSILFIASIGLGATIIGLIASRAISQMTLFSTSLKINWGWPWYLTAVVAAILSGCDITLFGIHNLFDGLVPAAIPLLLYAAIAYGIALIEQKPRWLWLAALFAAWGTVLSMLTSLNFTVAIALVAGLGGLAVGRLPKLIRANTASASLSQFRWSWPWYLTSFVAMLVTVMFSYAQPNNFVSYSLLAFTTLTIAIMLVERMPEAVVLPAALAALAIGLWQPHPSLPLLMTMYTFLCVLIFTSQMVWKVLTPVERWLPAPLLHRVLGLAGQLLVVLTIITNRGLYANGNPLAFVGAGALLVLALLVFWYGQLQRDATQRYTFIIQRYCFYSSGLLASLVVSWVLISLQQTNLDLLLLSPATYIILIASVLMHDEALPYHYGLGQVAAILGAALLLLPTLWLSFTNSDTNLLYTIVLLGEALLMLMLGIGLGRRVFVLSGTGLIVVGALHALFLPSLGMPTYLVLTILGVTALAFATVLSLFGRQLQVAWQHWD